MLLPAQTLYSTRVYSEMQGKSFGNLKQRILLVLGGMKLGNMNMLKNSGETNDQDDKIMDLHPVSITLRIRPCISRCITGGSLGSRPKGASTRSSRAPCARIHTKLSLKHCHNPLNILFRNKNVALKSLDY